MSIYDAFFGKGILVNKETYESRITICKNCDFIIARKLICSRCFCPVTNKSAIKTESCPQGKWKSES